MAMLSTSPQVHEIFQHPVSGEAMGAIIASVSLHQLNVVLMVSLILKIIDLSKQLKRNLIILQCSITVHAGRNLTPLTASLLRRTYVKVCLSSINFRYASGRLLHVHVICSVSGFASMGQNQFLQQYCHSY